jgi:hypothetical protein
VTPPDDQTTDTTKDSNGKENQKIIPRRECLDWKPQGVKRACSLWI